MKLIDHYLSLEQIVSDTDSFLQEVSEELRRDRLQHKQTFAPLTFQKFQIFTHFGGFL